MKPDIEIGDYVGILEGTERGYVVKIIGHKVWFETKDGFELVSTINKLVKYNKPKTTRVRKETPSTSHSIKPAPIFPVKKSSIKKVKDKDFKVSPALIGESKSLVHQKDKKSIWEIDLHIEEIVSDYKHLSNGEIIDIQIRHARTIIEKARKNKIGKLIFIHGKGKGVLRSELLHLLSGYTFLEFYDASLKKYGGGATEVRLFTSKI